MTAAAIGVFAAAPSTATMPTAASIAGGRPSQGASTAPHVVPMKKIGVRMPPLPPTSSVIDVARIFSRNAPAGINDRAGESLIDRLRAQTGIAIARRRVERDEREPPANGEPVRMPFEPSQ